MNMIRLQAVTRILEHHDPFPAVVLNQAYDLLRSNTAFDALIGSATYAQHTNR